MENAAKRFPRSVYAQGTERAIVTGDVCLGMVLVTVGLTSASAELPGGGAALAALAAAAGVLALGALVYVLLLAGVVP